MLIDADLYGELIRFIVERLSGNLADDLAFLAGPRGREAAVLLMRTDN